MTQPALIGISSRVVRASDLDRRGSVAHRVARDGCFWVQWDDGTSGEVPATDLAPGPDPIDILLDVTKDA